ncbi:MAG: tetratricopeptide repeat protein [Chitinispirillales bacterium]|nr:tetratricopeptide repeat protein [Chitinispirillales bacterium]
MDKKMSENVLNFINRKQSSIVFAAVLAAIVILVVLSFNYLSKQKHIEGQKAFAEAVMSVSNGNDDAFEKLKAVADEYKGTSYSCYSLALAGKTLLDKKEYREAAIVFDEALKAKQTTPFFVVQLYDSKATALEYDGALDDALAAYKKALSVPNNYFRRNEILLKSALLNLRMNQNNEAIKLFKEIIADTGAEEKHLRIAKNELEALEALNQ